MDNEDLKNLMKQGESYRARFENVRNHYIAHYDPHELDVLKKFKVEKDDLEKILPAYKEADIVVFASPIYYFSHAEPLHQEGFCLIDNEGMDIADGCAARGLVNHIAKISSRISQL